jgi:two-component system sensor histidine kinase CssS
MKRLRMWLRELTLTQQLLAIIFILFSIFCGFIFWFIAPAVARFSETEMYRNLHNSQPAVISTLDANPNRLPRYSSGENFNIIQAVCDKDGTVHVLSSRSLPEELLDSIRSNAALDVSGTQDYSAMITVQAQDGTVNDQKCLYSMTLLKDGRYLVSVMENAYQVPFRKSLTNGIIVINVVFVFALLLVLLLWTGSLIVPLNQIKAYITKLKNEEPAELKVRRNDEIGEVADALRDMDRELARQNHEKQEMIQNISHDLKTPIATIKSYSEAIKDGIYPYDTLEKSVDVIIEHADRLEKKVKSLIVLNKMDYLADRCPEGNNLNMKQVIDKVLLSLKVVRPEISFDLQGDDTVCFHGEEEPWRITVENLIDNALRYAKSTITVSLKEGELCVINDGDPIAEDTLSSLFHPYEKGSGGQFGLGLSIVWRVCTTYGYHVQAENLTDGVCFRITQEKRKKTRRTREGKEEAAQSTSISGKINRQ